MQTQLTIEVQSLAPSNGTLLTPVWFGFHNGSFDTYDQGRPVSPGIERIAEDGTLATIGQEFQLSGFGTGDGAVFGPAGAPGPIDAGEVAIATVTLDGSAASSRFFSYAAMIIPSNDFFVSNGNEQAHPIFDAQGNFIGADFTILGSQVLDAGSEVNEEVPANTAFFGQQTPNTGVTENGVVTTARGFIPQGAILSSPQFANADFTAPNYRIARVRIFNTINGQDTNDNLSGTQGDDLISGLGGDDDLSGGRGNDRLLGGLGNDILSGGAGNDELFGNDGNDRLRGGVGQDRLVGGIGFDTLTGGADADIFVLAAGTGWSTITDFNLGSGDRLSLSGISFADLAITAKGNNAVISFGNDELAILRNTTVDSITQAAFV
jgi:Ca2+-binding RTX toxin-like protein